MEKHGKAIFNLQRFQILNTKINETTNVLIPNSYAYAWYEKLFPFLDDYDLHYDLEEYFEIKKEKVDSISLWADKLWRDKKYQTFYEYENYYRYQKKDLEIYRHDLIATFRYLFLSETFDDIFWKTLIKPEEHPTEASRIIKDFSINELYLI